MKKKIILLAALLFTSSALADRKDADKCAMDLPTKSKIIYNAAIDRVVPGAVEQNKEMMRELVGGMISLGKLSIDEAYSSALPAVDCLKRVNIGYEIIDRNKTP